MQVEDEERTRLLNEFQSLGRSLDVTCNSPSMNAIRARRKEIRETIEALDADARAAAEAASHYDANTTTAPVAESSVAIDYEEFTPSDEDVWQAGWSVQHYIWPSTRWDRCSGNVGQKFNECGMSRESFTFRRPVKPKRPVVKTEYDSTKVIADAEARRLQAIEKLPDAVRDVAVGELLHPGDWNHNFDVTWKFQWGSVALHEGWQRRVVRLGDVGLLLQARKLANQQSNPVTRDRMLYRIAASQNEFCAELRRIMESSDADK